MTSRDWSNRSTRTHPVMTVVAEIGGDKVANFQRLCPNVDILGINSYGGVQSLG